MNDRVHTAGCAQGRLDFLGVVSGGTFANQQARGFGAQNHSDQHQQNTDGECADGIPDWVAG